jgi:hypothetical protein
MSRASSQLGLCGGVAVHPYASPVVVALIAIGVIAFLAIDAYIIYRVFQSRARADDHGSFMVPGEATVTLPAGGKLKISYQEEYKAGGTEDTIDFGVPAALDVQVSGASGEPMEIKGPGFRGMGSSLDTGSGWSRALVGTVEITEPGEYTVTAGPAIEGGVEPKILLGK